MAYKYSKAFINGMAHEFMNLLTEHGMCNSCCVYFNGKRYRDKHYCIGDANFFTLEIDEGNFHPLDITEYTVSKNILSFSTEGYLYDVLNYYGIPVWLESFCKKYNLYMEPATSWFFHFCPDGTEDWSAWETDNKGRKERTYLYHGNEALNSIPKVKAVADFWYNLSKEVGDIGSCVLGAGFTFNYEGQSYKLAACSPYQGSVSWELDKDLIHKCLEHIGCTDIRYDWGNMD